MAGGETPLPSLTSFEVTPTWAGLMPRMRVSVSLDRPSPNNAHVTITRNDQTGQPVIVRAINFPTGKQQDYFFGPVDFAQGDYTFSAVPSLGHPATRCDGCVLSANRLVRRLVGSGFGGRRRAARNAPEPGSSGPSAVTD